jgi:exopolysaccharide production protein ExoQ
LNDSSQSGFAALNPQGVRPALRLSVGGFSQGVADEVDRASFAEKLFVVCVLVFSTTAFVNLFPGERGLEYGEQGLLFAQIMWSFFYLAMLFLVRRRIVEFVRLMWQSKSLVLLLGWACLSAVWSITAQVTIRRFVGLLFSSLFGIYFGVRYDLRKQLRLVSIALGIVIAASVFACLVFPEYGISTSSENPLEEPAWQGVLSHKNNLATLLILAALVLALYFLGRVRRPLIVVGIVPLFCLVVLTQSKTALVYFVLGIFAFPFLRAFQRNPSKRRKIVAFALLIAVGFATWTYNNWDNLTYSLGKDPGLTGRFMLWGVSLESIRERPLLGYGFAAFWSSYYGPAADFRSASRWFTGATAQNGFINLWLDLGLIGVLLFVVSFTTTYRQALSLAKMAKPPEGHWPIAFLTFLFIYSLTEIDFLTANNLYWILYVSTGAGIRSLLARGYQQS